MVVQLHIRQNFGVKLNETDKPPAKNQLEDKH